MRALEQGRAFTLAELSAGTVASLGKVRSALDARFAARDWARYTRQAVEFHLRNASAWANDRAGEDLSDQVDPDFVLGPHALTVMA